MSPGNLETLKQHRQELLLAEVAAWLHDMGKCADEHIINQASDKPSLYSYKYKTAQSPRLPTTLPSIRLLGETVTVKDLIEKGMPKIISDASQPWPLRVLGKCHAVAHVEKELEVRETSTKQPKDDTRLSSAFGVEDSPIKDLTLLLSDLQFASMQNRSAFVPHAEKTFDSAMGDTRRPVNEVTLADWTGTVSALYKPALAGALLGIKPDPDDLRWRLLRVNFDVLGLFSKAIKTADLLGYQRAVAEACQQVKQLVEEEYPLGNEIYRDTTGIYFTFPDLSLPAELELEIRRRVEDVEPELAPRIAITQGDGATAQEQLKGILGKAHNEAIHGLQQPFDQNNLSPRWAQNWANLNREKKWEVCPVCRLRPKEEQAEVCSHCENRRSSRLEAWKQNPSRTIWVGEIADHNDRVAILVGKFGLEDWLSGDLVQTMLVKAANNAPEQCVPKNPSPARLRRVWETCQRFWSETVLQDIPSKAFGTRGIRKHITPDKTNWQPGLYNGKVNGKPIDLFWQPEHNAFLTISNMQAAGELSNGATISIEHPETRRKAEFQIQNIGEAPAPFNRYQPFLPLHASPDQFLALVPAADALKIGREIRTQYEEQFGKVRNRLPLSLGLVFCERKMPLMAAMDAARQMLNTPLPEEEWKVAQDVADGHVQFKNGITWNVQTVMGDGEKPDEWYPYYFVTQANPGQPTRRFQLRKEGDNDTQKVGAVSDTYADRWLVHVNDLKQGDVVGITPSCFDFLWLDAASRRFEIHYDPNGRRPARPSRPFYLEDLGRLDELWQYLQQLSRTQLKQILQTIETTRERWFGRDEQNQSAGNDTFRQFVADTLANAQWAWTAIPPDKKDRLIIAAVRGELADLAELHLEILKEKNEGVHP